MPVTAKLCYLRIAPRKVRLISDLIRSKKVEEAQTILNFINKRAALPLLKLLKQAIANAKNNFQLEEKNLYISKILVDEGSKLKRTFPRARGKADILQKKTSHITIVLDVIKETIPLRKGVGETSRLPRVGKQPPTTSIGGGRQKPRVSGERARSSTPKLQSNFGGHNEVSKSRMRFGGKQAKPSAGAKAPEEGERLT
jgi:large subunit ribosomal protein L22